MVTTSDLLIRPAVGGYITDGQRLLYVLGLNADAHYQVENAATGKVETLVPKLLTEDVWRIIILEETNGA